MFALTQIQTNQRLSYYTDIARARVRDAGGGTPYIEACMRSVFIAYENENLTISLKRQRKITQVIGNKLNDCITNEFIRKMVEIYKLALSHFTDEEVKDIARKPMDDPKKSPRFAKFLAVENAAFSPQEERITDELMRVAIDFFKNQDILNEIYQLAHGKKK